MCVLAHSQAHTRSRVCICAYAQAFDEEEKPSKKAAPKLLRAVRAFACLRVSRAHTHMHTSRRGAPPMPPPPRCEPRVRLCTSWWACAYRARAHTVTLMHTRDRTQGEEDGVQEPQRAAGGFPTVRHTHPSCVHPCMHACNHTHRNTDTRVHTHLYWRSCSSGTLPPPPRAPARCSLPSAAVAAGQPTLRRAPLCAGFRSDRRRPPAYASSRLRNSACRHRKSAPRQPGGRKGREQAVDRATGPCAR